MEIQDIIKETVKETIAELMRQDRLTEDSYDQAKELIQAYYNGESKEAEKAIESMKKDRYFRILPLAFKDGYTNEQLAIAYDCEVSTIKRNKKRLCLEVLRRTK